MTAVACLTNSIECLLVLLAAGAIGAIFSSTAPDMGVEGIVERYSQVDPKILFVDTEVLYAGKKIDLRKKMAGASSKLRDTTQLKMTVVVQGRKFVGEGV